MTWIETIPPERATGLLGKLYRQAVERAGKVFHVLRCQSLRPEVLERSVDLYVEVMRSERSPLTRVQRELIATTVSRANDCFY
jgi:alkylhydroperoxidase family enzyme